MMPKDLEAWRAWIGRVEESRDVIDPLRARAMQAALDDPGAPLGPGDALPPLWHWLYFWTVAPEAELGPDGHAARGGFLPPIDLPRRMWAGSRVSFPRPLPVGAAATRRSEIADVTLKEGRSGPLAFVTVRHQVATDEGICVEEEQDLVYRAAPAPGAGSRPGEPAPATAAWRREMAPDPVLLFRYSALTFNGHRIHYDLKFSTEVEGYPGLVVHGPLLATLMVELARRERPEARVTGFEFRAQRPIFDTAPYLVAGAPAADGASAELWVAGSDGCYASRGRIELA
jgi:3-methylfumaryl-CoA hydratase